jgi:hypothetical protein
VSARLEGLDAVRRQLVGLAQSFGEQWSAAVQFTDEPRRPYPTLTPRLRPAGPQPTTLQVIEGLRGQGRDVFALDETDRAEITRDALARLEGRALGAEGLNTGAIMLSLGAAWKRRVVARVEAGAFKAPSAKWTERKVRLGLDARALNASHQTLDALRRANLTVHRTR